MDEMPIVPPKKTILLAEVGTYEHRLEDVLKQIREHIARMEVQVISLIPEEALEQLKANALEAQEYGIKFYVVLGQMAEGLDSGQDEPPIEKGE